MIGFETVRKVAGDKVQENDVSITSTGGSSSSRTYGDFLNDNPAIKAIEQVKSGGSISDSEKNTSIKEAAEQVGNGFKDVVENAGLDPENPELTPDPDVDFSNAGNDFGEIWENNRPEIDAGQKVQDLTNPVAGLMPEIPEPEVNADVNLGLGKAAKYGAAATLLYVVLREVL